MKNAVTVMFAHISITPVNIIKTVNNNNLALVKNFFIINLFVFLPLSEFYLL